MCLDLSETKTHIEADGEVIWSNESGRTGVRFQRIAQESLLELRQWLFINNMIACVNHPGSLELADHDGFPANSLHTTLRCCLITVPHWQL